MCRRCCAILGERQTLSLLVEGGGELLGSFFDRGLVDKVQAIVAPMIIGGRDGADGRSGSGRRAHGGGAAAAGGRRRAAGQDVLVTGYVGNRGVESESGE